MSGREAVPAERLALLEGVLDALEGRGLPRAEVYAKRGRARVIEETPGGVTVSYHREEGWAVRAGDDRRSLFATATGAPRPEGPGGAWPEADGEALTLPDPVAPPAEAAGDRSDPAGAWREPPELDAPLIGEREAVGLLATLGEELAAELPGTRILRARLSDGASEWEIASRLDGGPGVAGAARGRVALLRVEAVSTRDAGGPGGGAAVRAALEVAAREAVALEPRALARRLADRLSVAARGSAAERDRAVALLAPAVGARLLAGLVPLFFGEAGDELGAGLLDRAGRFASDAVTVVDDGRLPGGLLAAPVDGEGLPTAAAALVRSGERRPPLVASVRAGGGGRRPGRGQPAGRSWGCMRRPSWRDLPAPGPSHLYFEPSGGLGVGEMLREVARGYYLIDVDGAPRIDPAADRISIPVVGFRVERGAAASPLAGAVIEGGLGPFLRRIEAAARDLTFFPLAGGMVGAPTLRVEGVELVRS